MGKWWFNVGLLGAWSW